MLSHKDGLYLKPSLKLGELLRPITVKSLNLLHRLPECVRSCDLTHSRH